MMFSPTQPNHVTLSLYHLFIIVVNHLSCGWKLKIIIKCCRWTEKVNFPPRLYVMHHYVWPTSKRGETNWQVALEKICASQHQHLLQWGENLQIVPLPDKRTMLWALAVLMQQPASCWQSSNWCEVQGRRWRHHMEAMHLKRAGGWGQPTAHRWKRCRKGM